MKKIMHLILDNIIQFIQAYKEDEVEVYSAQAAFFIILSFFPFITCLTSLLSLTPVTLEFFEDVVLSILPSYLDDIFDPFFRNNYIDTNVVFSISVVFALWTASKGVQNLTIGLNKIFNIKETRSWLKVRIISTFYMLIIMTLLISSLGMLVLGRHISEWLTLNYPKIAHIVLAVMAHRKWILFLIMIVIFDILYIALPNNGIHSMSLNHLLYMLPGAVLSAICWFVISIAFYVAIEYFGGFAFYGPVAAMVMLMFWICACLITFMVGGLINRRYSGLILKWKSAGEELVGTSDS